jgi:hypothetical protein
LLRHVSMTPVPRNPDWLRVTELLFANAESTMEDFTNATYAASKEPSMSTVAKELISRMTVRFPESEGAHRFAGWCHINLGDPAAAVNAFLAARATLKPDEHPGTDLLAGLALAQWLTDQQDEAIATYRQLVEAGRTLTDPTDWADPDKIADLDRTDAEKIPLEALRAATVAKHPELAPALNPNAAPNDN